MTQTGDYSQVADAQLDILAAGPDVNLYNAVLDVCALILQYPAKAQAVSSAIATEQGVRMRLAVANHYPYKVFWSTTGPRIEAVFPHP